MPPFSNKPIKGVVQYPGDGYSITNYSKNKAAAAAFLAFLATPQASAIINKAGLIPDVTGTKTTNPVNQQMLNFAKHGYTPYPMLDNVVQGDVVNAGSKVLPSVLAGKMSPASALGQMKDAWQQLPSSQRGSYVQLASNRHGCRWAIMARRHPAPSRASFEGTGS